MFHIFRRHQKVLLTTIATVAIGSMAFSAVAPLFLDDKKSHQVNQQDLVSQLDLGLICLFDKSFDASSSGVIFPEAIFTETLIDTGILKSVFATNKAACEQELSVIFEKMASFEPKQIMPQTTSYDLIAQVSPKLFSLIKQLSMAKNLTSEKKLDLLEAFFKEKNRLPLPLLQQYVYGSTKGQVKVDLEDLFYFGLEKPQHFFGETLVKKSTQALAKVVNPEMQSQSGTLLLQNLSMKLNQFYGSSVHPNQFFIACGVTPECGLDALKVIEAVKVLKHQISDSLLVDPLSYKTFAEYATNAIGVEKVSFNSEYEPKTLEQAALLELYCGLKDPLFAEEYQIKIRSIDKTKTFKKLPKKELYKEALKDYSKLSEMMPYALSSSLASEKDQLEAIKNLSGASKEILENHVRKMILQNDPSFYQKALSQEKAETKTLYLSTFNQKAPLTGFASCMQLKKELDILPLNTPVMFDLDSPYLYEIELVSKTNSQEPLGYGIAVSSGLLKEKLSSDLELLYKDQLRKNPSRFLNAQKKVKTFDEAYQDLLEISLTDLKTKLSKALGVSSDLMSTFLLKGYPKYVLSQQVKTDDFRISKSIETLARFEEDDKSVKALFNAPVGSKSDVILNREGHYVMYKKVEAERENSELLDKKALKTLADEKIKHVFSARVKDII